MQTGVYTLPSFVYSDRTVEVAHLDRTPHRPLDPPLAQPT